MRPSRFVLDAPTFEAVLKYDDFLEWRGNAERAARARFGNMLRLKEQGHDVRTAPTLENVVRRVQTEDIDMQSMPAESVEAQVRATAQGLVTQLNAVLRTTLRTIENLSRGMADLPGRKIVNLVTESLTTAGGSSGDITNQMLQTIDQARRSGVSVYALDAGGVKSNNVSASERVTATGLQIRNLVF